MRLRFGLTALLLVAGGCQAAVPQEVELAGPQRPHLAEIVPADDPAADAANEPADDDTEEMPEDLAETLPPEFRNADRTLPATVFYQDIEYFHGWHIQQNVLTQVYRLLDEDDRRHTWGTLEHCREALEEIKEAENLPPMSGTAVIVLHGLGGWRSRMKTLCDYLEAEGGYTVINVCYPSTRDDLESHAAALKGIVERLEGIEQIHFVGHSMGNIVIRRYLADTTDPVTGQQGDGRLGRVVMLAPPNHGAALAEKFAEYTWYTLLLGDAAVELTPAEWPATEEHLATPSCPFGIIAGSVAVESGGNPLIPGEDDLMVAVDETRLAGASDFVVLPLTHPQLDSDATVCEYTLQFLQNGYFISEEAATPIEQDEPNPQTEEEQAPAPILENEAELLDDPFGDPFGDRVQNQAGGVEGSQEASGP